MTRGTNYLKYLYFSAVGAFPEWIPDTPIQVMVMGMSFSWPVNFLLCTMWKTDSDTGPASLSYIYHIEVLLVS